MSTSKDYNSHAVNDFLNRNPNLNTFEFRVAYYTVHADFGRRKKGMFWEGALSIESKIHVNRRVIKNCWKKMQAFGWLRDTGKKIGRATVWQINYDLLQKEATSFKEREAMKGSLPKVVQELLDMEGSGVGHPSNGSWSFGQEANGHGVATTLPKDSSKIIHQKDLVKHSENRIFYVDDFLGEVDKNQEQDQLILDRANAVRLSRYASYDSEEVPQ